MKTILVLLTEVGGLLIIFVLFLLVLNYFKIVSLSGLFPNQLGKLPQTAQTIAPTYDSKLSLWSTKGTFYGYNQHIIQIKINNQITNFQWADGNSKAAFYGSANDLSNPNYSPTIYTLYDLEQNQNFGKKVIVQYTINNGTNIIANLSLFKL